MPVHLGRRDRSHDRRRRLPRAQTGSNQPLAAANGLITASSEIGKFEQVCLTSCQFHAGEFNCGGHARDREAVGNDRLCGVLTGFLMAVRTRSRILHLRK